MNRRSALDCNRSHRRIVPAGFGFLFAPKGDKFRKGSKLPDSALT
jgi:hypothetical protein